MKKFSFSLNFSCVVSDFFALSFFPFGMTFVNNLLCVSLRSCVCLCISKKFLTSFILPCLAQSTKTSTKLSCWGKKPTTLSNIFDYVCEHFFCSWSGLFSAFSYALIMFGAEHTRRAYRLVGKRALHLLTQSSNFICSYLFFRLRQLRAFVCFVGVWHTSLCSTRA